MDHPSRFEDYLFDNGFDWKSIPCSADPPSTACGVPIVILTIDLDLKHIPWLDICMGNFALTTNVVFKSHTSVSKGWRSRCRIVLTHTPFMDILQKVHLVHTMLVFSSLDISKDSKSLLSLLYRWNSTTYTFFTGCQEVSSSPEDVYEILGLPLFKDGEVANICLSPNKVKPIKFLEDAIKKTLKKCQKTLV